MGRSIRNMLEDLGVVTPKKPGRPGGKDLVSIRISKHWITRNGRKIRATKKYHDNRQKP